MNCKVEKLLQEEGRKCSYLVYNYACRYIQFFTRSVASRFQKIITLKTFQHVNCLTNFAISGNAAGRLLSAFFKALYWVFKDKDPKNLSLKSQLCEASMQTHMHAYVCAQWVSTSGHCHHTHCLPTAAVVSKHF